MTASIDVDDVAGSLNFNALEDVVGALSVSGSDSLTSFSANALRSISGDVFLSSMDTIDSLRFPSLVSIGGTLDVTLEFLDELEFASLVDVDRVLIENNIRLTRLVFSSLAQVGSGDVGDTFTLRNSASALAAGDTFRVLMPATPAIVDGTIVITDNRRITAEAALAVAAKLDNSASGFAAPTVTNNRP